MFVHKYSDLSERKNYMEMVKIPECQHTKKYHLGQLKLLISEIMYLTKKAKPGNKVLYIGAAGGYHTAYLADMFPDLTFDLWDGGRFDIQDRPNIKIMNRFFTNNCAQNYSKDGKNILFISDIRNLAIADMIAQGISASDEIINEDNAKQLTWIQIINPICAFLKFRPPYSPGKTEYLKGNIYLQTYSPVSTETRLLVCRYDDYTIYDNTEFDEKLAYFNCIIRPDPNKDKLNRWATIMEKHKIKNSWDNNYAFYVLYAYLDKVKGIKSDEKTLELFLDIIKFLKDKYGTKYDFIFE